MTIFPLFVSNGSQKEETAEEQEMDSVERVDSGGARTTPQGERQEIVPKAAEGDEGQDKGSGGVRKLPRHATCSEANE